MLLIISYFVFSSASVLWNIIAYIAAHIHEPHHVMELISCSKQHGESWGTGIGCAQDSEANTGLITVQCEVRFSR